MGKSKIPKRISPGLTIEPDIKNVPYGHHFPKCITSMYKLDTIVKAIREKLTKR